MKKSTKIILLAVLILLGVAGYNILSNLSGNEMTPEEELQAYKNNIESIELAAAKRWKHLDKVWPGLDYSNVNMVITQKMTDGRFIGWVVDGKGKRELTQEELTALDKDIQGQVYMPYSFEGKNTMASGEFLARKVLPGLDAERQEHSFFELLTHEALHFYFQEEFQAIAKKLASSSSRSTQVPFESTPRLYRLMTIERLQEAFIEQNEEKRSELIGKASFWYNKWKTEFPVEVKNLQITDVVEGQAFYVENMVSAITESGVEGVDREYLISRFADLEAIVQDMDADAESYKIGYVAGVLLDTINPNWKEGYLTNGIPPAELLLADYPVVSDTKNAKLHAAVKKVVLEKNEEIIPYLANIDEALADKSIPYLQVSGDDLGNFEPRAGFLFYKNTAVVGQTVGNLVLHDQKLSLDHVNMLTHESGDNLIPMTQSYSIEGNIISFDDETMNGAVTFARIENQDGRTVYVVE